VQAYLKHTAAWKQQLAPKSLAALQALEAKGDYDSPEYGRIMMEELYPQMICRTRPWPEPVTRVFRHVNETTIGARYDEMDPKDMQKMASLMPNATSAYCPNGSHLCMWDDQAVYFHHLLQFLHSV
jgi:proline iminopeptidase